MAVQTTYPLVPAIGFPGMPADSGPNDVITGINVGATSLAMGCAVARASGSQQAMARLAAITDLIPGILMHSNAYDPTELEEILTAGHTAVRAGCTLNIWRKGRLFVLCENGCTKGQRLHIRCVATGQELFGALRSAADGTDTKDCSGQGEWMSNAAAGAIAELEVDFTNPLT